MAQVRAVRIQEWDHPLAQDRAEQVYATLRGMTWSNSGSNYPVVAEEDYIEAVRRIHAMGIKIEGDHPASVPGDDAVEESA